MLSNIITSTVAFSVQWVFKILAVYSSVLISSWLLQRFWISETWISEVPLYNILYIRQCILHFLPSLSVTVTVVEGTSISTAVSPSGTNITVKSSLGSANVSSVMGTLIVATVEPAANSRVVLRTSISTPSIHMWRDTSYYTTVLASAFKVHVYAFLCACAS